MGLIGKAVEITEAEPSWTVAATELEHIDRINAGKRSSVSEEVKLHTDINTKCQT